VQVQVRGGLFQDFAPSFYHVRHVVLPLLQRMGFAVEIEMGRPGYIPRGDGLIRLHSRPVQKTFGNLVLEPGSLRRIRGIALASHLKERHVGERMANAGRDELAASGYDGHIDVIDDDSAAQPRAVLALFADLEGGARLGAGQAGARGRTSEAIGRCVARQLIEDFQSGATLDRYTADQIIPFAGLAKGESRFRIPAMTDHIASNAWLTELFLGARVTITGQTMTIQGVGFRSRS
jgi:RNA 3'-terminal phosphate cyclase (ATP)